MSQFPYSDDDTSSLAAPGDNPPTGWPFSFGAPVRVNAWGAPIFPQTSAASPGAFPFAPPASAGNNASRLPDWWIAEQSLLGAIPRQLNRPVGSDGLLGLLAEPTNPPADS